MSDYTERLARLARVTERALNALEESLERSRSLGPGAEEYARASRELALTVDQCLSNEQTCAGALSKSAREVIAVLRAQRASPEWSASPAVTHAVDTLLNVVWLP